MWVPSGEKPTEVTVLVCPLRGFMTSSPVFASHIRIVLLSEPDTMWVPSGEKPTEVTVLVCPRSSRSGLGCSWIPSAVILVREGYLGMKTSAIFEVLCTEGNADK
jgi:hypothetical protein